MIPSKILIRLFAGQYIYLEASAPRVQGDRCWLQSQSFGPTQGSCVSFWYSMYGVNIGTLNVYAAYSNGQNRTLWTLSGDQGNTWKNGQAPLSSGISFKVLLAFRLKCEINTVDCY